MTADSWHGSLRAQVLEIETPSRRRTGTPARAPTAPARALVLGHGAGGGVAARDLVAASDVALCSRRVSVALVEQPYRVAGRRSPAPARQLDAAWTRRHRAACGWSRSGGLPLIVGGRSVGGAGGLPDGRGHGRGRRAVPRVPVPAATAHRRRRPPQTRLDELDAVQVPMLIVQGETDPFGMPPRRAPATVVTVRGDHSLRGDLEALGTAVGRWLARIVARTG